MLNGDGITYKNEELTNDEFWPDLNLGDFQKKSRYSRQYRC